VLALCDRFKVLPSQLLAEPADPLLRLLELEALAAPTEGGDDGQRG
jgi:hypothetical protein